MSSPSSWTPEQKRAYNSVYCRLPYVRDAHNTRTRAKQRSQRHFLAGYKVYMGCMDCGYANNPVALDLDHVSGEKKFSCAQPGDITWECLLQELSKCIVRCSNCHRIRTWNKQGK